MKQDLSSDDQGFFSQCVAAGLKNSVPADKAVEQAIAATLARRAFLDGKSK